MEVENNRNKNNACMHLLTSSLVPEQLIKRGLQLLAPLQPFSFPCHLVQLEKPTCKAVVI